MFTHIYNYIINRDTGYRSVPIGTDPNNQYDEDYLDSLPHCPAFKGKQKKIQIYLYSIENI